MGKHSLEIRVRDRKADLAIDLPFLRIGSGPACEIRLPAEVAPAHLATLETNGDQFFVHPAACGSSGPPASPTRVKLDQTFRLNEIVSIRVRSGAPARPRKAWALAAPRADRPGGPEAPTRDPQDKYAIGGIIFVLLLASTTFLLRQPDAKAQAAEELRQLVEAVHTGGEDRDPVLMNFRGELQEAHIATLRGDTTGAAAIYAIIRDQILQRRRPDGSFAKDFETKVYSLIGRMLTH